MEDRGLGKGFYSFFLAFCRFHTPKGKDFCHKYTMLFVTKSRLSNNKEKKVEKFWNQHTRELYSQTN